LSLYLFRCRCLAMGRYSTIFLYQI
jgi:hypothetical protein